MCIVDFLYLKFSNKKAGYRITKYMSDDTCFI